MKNNYLLFATLGTITLGLNLLSKELLDIEESIINSLAETLTNEEIQGLLSSRNKFQWVGFISSPLLLLIKISIISAILDAGCFFFNKEIRYKTLFNIVVKAEFLFLLAIIFKTLWFYMFQQDYTLEDLQYFYPLSLLNIVGYEGLQPWFIYPLQIVNIFEIVYWGILAYLLGKTLNITTDKGMSIVTSSYGVGLVIWIASIMFFTLNMS